MRTKENRFKKALKKKLIKKAGFQCQICSCAGNYTTLEPHHIIFVCNGGSTSANNCLIVCHDCHVKIHNKGA